MLTAFTLIAVALLGGGPLLAHFALVSPLLALATSATGLSLLALLFFAAIAKFLERGTTNWLSVFLGLLALGGIGGIGYQMFLNPLHDITTTAQNPPRFLHPVYPFQVEKGSEYLDESLRLNRDYNLADGGTQLRLYPTFAADAIKVPTADAYTMALKTIQNQLPDWKVVLADEESHHIEAEVEEPVFHSVSDVVVEVRGDPKHAYDSKVEMRARLRVNWSDFGWDMFLLRDLRVRLNLAIEPLEEQFSQKRADFEADAGKPKVVVEPPKAPEPPKPLSMPSTPMVPLNPGTEPVAPPVLVKAPPATGSPTPTPAPAPKNAPPEKPKK